MLFTLCIIQIIQGVSPLACSHPLAPLSLLLLGIMMIPMIDQNKGTLNLTPIYALCFVAFCRVSFSPWIYGFNPQEILEPSQEISTENPVLLSRFKVKHRAHFFVPYYGQMNTMTWPHFLWYKSLLLNKPKSVWTISIQPSNNNYTLLLAPFVGLCIMSLALSVIR